MTVIQPPPARPSDSRAGAPPATTPEHPAPRAPTTAQDARPSVPPVRDSGGHTGDAQRPPEARPWATDTICYLDADGFEHQLTVHAPTGQEAIAAGLAAAKALKGRNYRPAERAAPQSPDSGGQAVEAAPICQIHKTPMQKRTNARGSFWSCPQKLDDGSWCPYRLKT